MANNIGAILNSDTEELATYMLNSLQIEGDKLTSNALVNTDSDGYSKEYFIRMFL